MNFLRVHRVHFVGIGGVGMSGLAEILASVGLTVTGSDLREGEETRRLRALGIPVFAAGHRAEHVAGADVVVYSSAVAEDNAELVAARIAGVPVIKRAEMLAEVMRVKTGIAIAGSHGKTTTTSMAGSILQVAGLDPTIVVGGRVRAMGTNARLGEGEYLVAEADEFDRSFLRLRPVIAVVNNIDLEHLDTYRDLADLKAAFTEFAGTVPFFGAALLGLDDPNVQEIRPLLSARVRVGTFGLTPQADVTARDLALDRTCSRFTAVAGGEVLGTLEVALPGLHNVKNALGAIAVSRELDVPFEACAKALSTFSGVARRFERKGERGGVLVVDDYAHHPTEVSATLGAARQAHPERRLVVVFQPHLFTRTRDQAEGFGAALLAADAVYVLPVYPSREKPIPGVTARLVSDAARARGHRSVVDLDDRAAAVARLGEELRAGDLLVTMGAGDVNRVGEEYLEAGGAP